MAASVKSNKSCHISPELQGILNELNGSSPRAYTQLRNLINNVHRDNVIFDVEKERPRRQDLSISGTIYKATIENPKKRRRDEDDDGKVEFMFISKWKEQADEWGRYNSDKLKAKLTTGDDRKIFKIKDEDIKIHWDSLGALRSELDTILSPEQILEFLRCCIYYNKASRIDTSKWVFPKPSNEAVQKVIFNLKPKPPPPPKLVDIEPANEGEALAKVGEMEKRVITDVVGFCKRVTTIPLPVKVKEIYMFTSRVEKQDIKHFNHLVAEVTVVVEADNTGNGFNLSQDYQLMRPKIHAELGKYLSARIYENYNDPLSYMRALLLNAGVTEAECERLKPIYTPWFKGLRWSDLKKKRKGTFAWDVQEIVAHVGKTHYHLKLHLQTNVPQIFLAHRTRAHKADKVYTKIWDTNTTLEQMEKVVRSVIEPTAEVSRAVEVYLAENA